MNGWAVVVTVIAVALAYRLGVFVGATKAINGMAQMVAEHEMNACPACNEIDHEHAPGCPLSELAESE